MVGVNFRNNMRKHEIIGAILIFIGSTWFGLGLYVTLLSANRLLVDVPLLSTNQLLIFPMFYGLSALLIMFGVVEIREMLPGKNR